MPHRPFKVLEHRKWSSTNSEGGDPELRRQSRRAHSSEPLQAQHCCSSWSPALAWMGAELTLLEGQKSVTGAEY